MDKEQRRIKTFITLGVGWLVLVVGVSLNLKWWDDFMLVLRGVSGISIAMLGLLIIYSLNKKA